MTEQIARSEAPQRGPSHDATTRAPASALLDLVASRYGAPDEIPGPPSLSDRADAVLQTQLAHRSVRAFLPDSLEPEVLPTLIAAAQSAPTSSNLQLWSVVAVTDPERKVRLATLAGDQRHIHTAPLLLVWVADLSRARALAQRADAPLAGTDYLESTIVAFLNAALAAQNAVVAAESLGLGTVYVGALRNHPEEVATELNLPTGAVAVAGLVVGHPDPDAHSAVKPRLPQQAVLHHEQYDASAHAEHADTYQRRIDAFYREQNLIGQWADRVFARLRGPESLSGRHRLREALTTLGLPSR